MQSITPDQSGPRSNGNEAVLHIPQTKKPKLFSDAHWGAFPLGRDGVGVFDRPSRLDLRQEVTVDPSSEIDIVFSWYDQLRDHLDQSSNWYTKLFRDHFILHRNDIVPA